MNNQTADNTTKKDSHSCTKNINLRVKITYKIPPNQHFEKDRRSSMMQAITILAPYQVLKFSICSNAPENPQDNFTNGKFTLHS